MKKIVIAIVAAALFVGCRHTDGKTGSGYSADFPDTEIENGQAMPAYTPWWKK